MRSGLLTHDIHSQSQVAMAVNVIPHTKFCSKRADFCMNLDIFFQGIFLKSSGRIVWLPKVLSRRSIKAGQLHTKCSAVSSSKWQKSHVADSATRSKLRCLLRPQCPVIMPTSSRSLLRVRFKVALHTDARGSESMNCLDCLQRLSSFQS